MGRLAEDVIISALSECIVQIYQEDDLEQERLLVQPIPGLAEICFLSVANKETLDCRLINLSGQDISLPADSPIALLIGLPDDTVIRPVENSSKGTAH